MQKLNDEQMNLIIGGTDGSGPNDPSKPPPPPSPDVEGGLPS